MTDPTEPSWLVTYRSGPEQTEPATLTITAPSFMTAMKRARMALSEKKIRAFKIEAVA